MDEGTDAKDILENKLLPLRRGEDQTNKYIWRDFFFLAPLTLFVILRRLHRRSQP